MTCTDGGAGARRLGCGTDITVVDQIDSGLAAFVCESFVEADGSAEACIGVAEGARGVPSDSLASVMTDKSGDSSASLCGREDVLQCSFDLRGVSSLIPLVLGSGSVDVVSKRPKVLVRSLSTGVD